MGEKCRVLLVRVFLRHKNHYKNKETQLGTFGGSAEDALSRITRPIQLECPVWSSNDYESCIYNDDINNLIDTLPEDIDIMYIDPPYNQHPYSSNYFMAVVDRYNARAKFIE